MSNAAINVAIMAAAQQQAEAEKVILGPLRAATATSPSRAIPLVLTAKGSEAALKSLIKRGYVRQAARDAYWIDEERIARAKQEGLRWALIILAVLTAVLVSLVAYLATR